MDAAKKHATSPEKDRSQPYADPTSPPVDAAQCSSQGVGMKHDAGKLLFGALMRGLARPLNFVAQVLTFGANKYDRDSWQTVPNAKVRYEDALYRHLNAWAMGEHKDPETGLPHLAHAACNILFLLHFDTEPPGGKDDDKVASIGPLMFPLDWSRVRPDHPGFTSVPKFMN